MLTCLSAMLLDSGWEQTSLVLSSEEGSPPATCWQEEREVCVQLKGYNRTGIMETWWDILHYWQAVTEEYGLFRTESLGRQGGQVALYVRHQLKCLDISLGTGQELVRGYGPRLAGRPTQEFCSGYVL